MVAGPGVLVVCAEGRESLWVVAWERQEEREGQERGAVGRGREW